jgi:hypothetical protein
MKNMILDETTGSIEIDGYPIDLTSVKDFTESQFFKNENDLKRIGLYYYYLESVKWLGNEFYIEFRPDFGVAGKKIFLIEKNTSFYSSMQDWSLRADLKLLAQEEIRLKISLESNLSYSSMRKIDKPPYGLEFEYSWGRVIIQSNKNDFNCGVYITWNNLSS